MKKILFAAALAAVSITGYANDTTKSNDFTEEVYYNDSKGYSVQTNSFWSNWYLSIGAGAQTYFGDHNKQLLWKNRISPAFDVALGKWFTPGIGVRGMYSGQTIKGATMGAAYSTGELINVLQFDTHIEEAAKVLHDLQKYNSILNPQNSKK